MDINAAFPSKFIKAADLQGQDVTVTIARFALESVDEDSGELKPVIYFAGHQRGLVLNKTNAITIADLYGTETERWIGRPVTLYPTHCQYGAKMVDCIRIRPFPPANGAAPQLAGQQPPPPPQPSGPTTHTLLPSSHAPHFQPFMPPPPPTASTQPMQGQPPQPTHTHVQF